LSKYAATVASSAWTKLAAAIVIANSARIEMLNGVRITVALITLRRTLLAQKSASKA
jgi:hypothetical protein